MNTNLNNTSNINTARRMANSWEKALKLVDEGYQFLKCTLPESPVTLVAVRKPTDAPNEVSYWIYEGFTAPVIKNGCTCPDFQKHNDFCKHTMAWDDVQKMEAAIAQFEEECKRIDEAECAIGVDYRY